MIEILQAGFLTSVQDLGRRGYRSMGVGLSGAMDTLALSIANLQIGNPVDTAGLEVTLGRFACTFERDTEIALGGADAQATLDGRPVANWWAMTVRAGQVLKLGAPRTGMRSYIAFRGGIAVERVLGSCATDLKGGFGGHAGRALAVGDRLAIRHPSLAGLVNPGFGLSLRKLNPYPEFDAAIPVIHVLPSGQWDAFAPAARDLLTQGQWTVSPQSNRVGCRLTGPELEMHERREMLSHGILPGVVQVPSMGQPIVQLCDGNTSGGYPVIATVIRADLHLFAQLPPKAVIRFAACDVAQAAARWAGREELLDAIARHSRFARYRFS